MLQKVRLQLVGIGPMLMHNNQLANPLNSYTKELQKLTSKRNKTEVDHLEIARLEWEGGLYLSDGIVVMPTHNINACFYNGGKKSKRGVKIKTGVIFEDNSVPLQYLGPKIQLNGNDNRADIPDSRLDEYFSALNFQTMVRVGPGRTLLRTRPMFKDWSLECNIIYDDTVIDISDIMKSAEDAGRLVGLGDWRPNFGRFMVERI